MAASLDGTLGHSAQRGRIPALPPVPPRRAAAGTGGAPLPKTKTAARQAGLAVNPTPEDD
jgi:hypothetical protein